MLKKLIRLNLDDMWMALGVVGGLFLLLHLATAVILHFFTDGLASVLVSGTVLPITSAFVILMISLGHTMAAYTMAVKFSQTRRRALGLTLGLVGFEAACSMGLAALLTLLERIAAPRLWMWLAGADGLVLERGGQVTAVVAGETPLLAEDVSLDWWWFPLLAAAAILLGLIMGAIILRFGRKGGWTLWWIWMAACLLPQLGFPSLPIADFLGWLAVFAAVFFAGLSAWSVWYLLRAPIKT